MKKNLLTTYCLLPTNQDGQSLLEILVALGVGTLLIIAATTIILPSLRTNTQADKVQVSAALGKQLLENVRVFSEGDWHNISGLATSSVNKYFLASAISPFAAATGTEGISADGITSGLVGYWKLDESAGTIAYDFSGNNSTGTIVGAPTSTTGQVGQALNFNGGQYIDTGSNSITGTNPFTLMAWIKATGFSQYGGAVSIGASVTGQSAYIGAVAGAQAGISNSIGGGFYGSNYGSGITTTGQWVHVAMTFSGGSGGTAIIYVNGKNSVSQTYTPNLASTYRRIGRIGSDTIYDFGGSIDDVRVYNRALSATEVKSIYDAGIYTRYFYLDSVGRDGSGNILSSGGTNDPSTKKATVVYGWAGGSTSSFSTYLTRFQNEVFDQTDWSGGSGQDGPVTTANNMFSTSTLMFYATTTGSIMIQLP